MKRRRTIALVTLPLFFVAAILGGALERDAALTPFLGGPYWQSFAYTIWESVMFMAAMTFLLYILRESSGGSGPLLRSLAAKDALCNKKEVWY